MHHLTNALFEKNNSYHINDFFETHFKRDERFKCDV